MSLITVAQVRGYIPDSAESDATLQMRIEENEAELTRRFGPLADDAGQMAQVTETVYADGTTLLPLRMEPAAIVSVTNFIGASGTVMDPGDYRTRGSYVERALGSWGTRTTVVYRPVDTRAERRRVLVKLIQCDMNYQAGLGSQGASGWNESYGKNYRSEREMIMATLGGQQVVLA